VLLALPEDMLFSDAAVADAPHFRTARAAPSPADMRELERLLSGAKQPFVLIGGGGWTKQAVDGLRAWAEAAGVPVGCGFRCQDYFDNRHPNYAGDIGIGLNPKLAQRVKDADVLLAIGERLGEMTTSAYTLVESPAPRQTLIHVQSGAEELGRVYRAALPINSNYEEFVFALSSIKTKREEWQNHAQAAHADYLAWNKPISMPGALHYGEVIAWLSQNLPEDAIVTNGAGNFASWLHRHFQYKGWRTQLAPTSGSMGYSVPAAVAAKIAAPGRTVVAIAGDGEFLMNGQEFATAMQYRAAIIVLVVNNGMYGTIRMHQEREYPGRVSGTELANPDFAAYARAFGGHGETVERTAEFAPAFQRAVASGKPAILELRIDPEAITPSATLSGLRAAALAKK
jgi:acetolactate synthase-1/2/3 large subunit